MMNFERKIYDYMVRESLVKKGEIVLIGVSGGPDSVALTHVLDAVRHHLAIDLAIAHINHQLRPSAAKDECFVAELAQKMGIPFHTRKVKIPRHGSLEEQARKKRLESLLSIARKIGAQTIALAHNEDDLAETVLMRLIRGTGLYGLQSIVPKRTFGRTAIIRPLLTTPRTDIESYLKQRHLKYRIDPTNHQLSFFRNKIRHKLFPLLEKNFNPAIKQTLTHLAHTAAWDYGFVESVAEKQYRKLITQKRDGRISLSLTQCRKLPVSLQRMIFRKAIEELTHTTLSFELKNIRDIEALLTRRPDGTVVHLPGRLLIEKKYPRLVFSRRKT